MDADAQTSPNPTPIQTAFRRVRALTQRPWFVALALALAVCLWLLSGQLGGNDTAHAAVSPATTTAEPLAPLVQVRRSQARQIDTVMEIRGHTEAWAQADLAAETEGRIIEVFRDAGDGVKAGEAILRIDPRARSEVLEQAAAVSRQRAAELDGARRLHKRGHVTDTQLAQAEAALAAALADEKRASLDLAATWVRSPLDGRLEARFGDVGDYLKVGGAVATVLDLGQLKLIANVTEHNIGQLKSGQTVEIRGVDGQRWPDGRLHFVAGSADGATRTYRVEVRIPNPKLGPAGESVRGRIVTGQTVAHKLPIGLVDLNTEGELGLFALETGADVVQRYAVKIERTDADQAWFSGLPETARVIVRGQGFVRPGQTVRSVDEG